MLQISQADLSRAICRVTAHSSALMGPGKAVMKTPSFSWHSYPLHTNRVARTVAQYNASATSPTSPFLAARSLYLKQHPLIARRREDQHEQHEGGWKGMQTGFITDMWTDTQAASQPGLCWSPPVYLHVQLSACLCAAERQSGPLLRCVDCTLSVYKPSCLPVYAAERQSGPLLTPVLTVSCLSTSLAVCLYMQLSAKLALCCPWCCFPPFFLPSFSRRPVWRSSTMCLQGTAGMGISTAAILLEFLCVCSQLSRSMRSLLVCRAEGNGDGLLVAHVLAIAG